MRTRRGTSVVSCGIQWRPIGLIASVELFERRFTITVTLRVTKFSGPIWHQLQRRLLQSFAATSVEAPNRIRRLRLILGISFAGKLILYSFGFERFILKG
jgi:hypothetical protein